MPDQTKTQPLANLAPAGKRWKARRLRPLCAPVAQVADLLVLSFAALSLQFLLTGGGAFRSAALTIKNVLLLLLCLVVWRLVLGSVGMYAPHRTRSLWDYGLRCVAGLNGCTLVLALIEMVWHRPGGVWRLLAVFWVTALAGMVLVRGLLWAKAGQHRAGRTGASWAGSGRRNLLIVGSGMRARELYAQVMEASPDGMYRMLGYLDSQLQDRCVPESMILGALADLEDVLLRHEVDEVVIALPMRTDYEAVGQVIATCQALGVQSQYFTDHFRLPQVDRPAAVHAPGEQTGRIPGPHER